MDVTPINSTLAASFSSVVVTVNTPPAAPSTEALVITGPGDVDGKPLAGYVNGLDQWTLSVAQVETGQSGWTGSGLLTYQFYYVDASGATNFLTSVSSALSVTTPLPLGYGSLSELPVGVVVYDANGGQSLVPADRRGHCGGDGGDQCDVCAADRQPAWRRSAHCRPPAS